MKKMMIEKKWYWKNNKLKKIWWVKKIVKKNKKKRDKWKKKVMIKNENKK